MPTVQPVATALPPHRFRQRELRDVAEATLPDGPGKASLLEIFDNSRIDERAFAVPVEWLLEPHGFKDRMQAFVDAALPLAEEAARGALSNAGLAPRDLAGIVYVCTTGIATPSLDARLCNRLGLRAGIIRLPVWGLGCAGGVAGLARAADLAERLQGPVLLVSLELCSLAFDVQKALGGGASGDGRGAKKALVAASLFADGSAATVVTPGNSGLRVRGTASHLFPDTERVMGWDVEDHNLDVVLSPEIPSIVERQMAGVVAPFADTHLGPGGRPIHWILHPGGAKVVDAYRTALSLGASDLEHTEEALRRHGNMSSPTVLFALADAQQKERLKPGSTALLGALGPGFAAELALLEAT